jgi:copper chaperone CopZ
MALRTEVLEVEGIHCMRCVQSIAAALQSVPELAAASANLMGDVTVAYEDEAVRAAAVAAIEEAGFEVTGSRAA